MVGGSWSTPGDVSNANECEQRQDEVCFFVTTKRPPTVHQTRRKLLHLAWHHPPMHVRTQHTTKFHAAHSLDVENTGTRCCTCCCYCCCHATLAAFDISAMIKRIHHTNAGKQKECAFSRNAKKMGADRSVKTQSFFCLYDFSRTRFAA